MKQPKQVAPGLDLRVTLFVASLFVVTPSIGLAQVAGSVSVGSEDTPALIDFDDAKESKRWVIVNDNVMGGRSSGGPDFTGSTLVFSGRTNTNGGGFSSIRTRPQRWPIGNATGLLLRVKGDGRVYKADLRTDNRMGRMVVAYRADFQTKKGEWIEVRLPFSQFKPSVYGSDMSGRTRPLNTGKIETLGFMIYDGRDGNFRLEVDWLTTY